MDLDPAANTVSLRGGNDSATDDVQACRRHNNRSLNVSSLHNDSTSLTGSNHVYELPSPGISGIAHIVHCGIQHRMVEDDVVSPKPQKPWNANIFSLDRHR